MKVIADQNYRDQLRIEKAYIKDLGASLGECAIKPLIALTE